MNNYRPMPVPQRKNGGFTVLIIILSVVLMLNFLIFLFLLNDSSPASYGSEYSDLIRTVKRSDYPELKRELLNNETRGYHPKKDTQELQKLADYFDAAWMYRAYTDSGMTEEAQSQKEIMDELEKVFSDPDVLDAVRDLQSRFVQ